MKRSAFTLLELLLILGILVVLLAIIVPYVASIREESQRVECASRLREIRDGFTAYTLANIDYPRVVYAPDMPGYTAYTGTDDADPFVTGASEDVEPNDITASLWLLMRGGFVADTTVFVCPSTWNSPDPMTNARGVRVGPAQRGNFSGRGHLSYSYANPFSDAESFGLKRDYLPGGFALMADINPGAGGNGAFPVPADATDAEFSAANSPNHNRGGQNVLYADASVRWHEMPYVGHGYVPEKVEDGKTVSAPVPGDNIYSSLSIDRLPADNDHDVSEPGYVGRNLPPAYANDSYLVPTDND